jgi:hypothetical protein
MEKTWFAFVLFVLLSPSIVFSQAFASVTVGVTEGNWIEYNVSYIGEPPEGHDITWARMEIVETKGANITIRITSKFPDQRREEQTTILNLETGHLIDAFIIPAYLKTGDTFLDENKGNVTINGTAQKTIAGAERTLVYLTTSEVTTYWDRDTGVAVEGSATLADFTMVTIAEKTNMWDPEAASSNTTLAYILIAAIVTSLVLVAIFVRRRGKRKTTRMLY